jgi:protein gp37
VSFEPLLEDLGTVDLSGIDWMVLGGESNQVRKPAPRCDVDWIRSLLEQGQEAGVRVFVKQLGDHATLDGKRVHYGKNGKEMELWPEDLRVREFPLVEAPRERGFGLP